MPKQGVPADAYDDVSAIYAVIMGEEMARKLGWPPDNRVLLGLAILFIFLAVGQAFDVLQATKTSSVVLHVVLASVQLAGSAFYFLL